MPIPRAENFDELNAHLESECLERMDARLRGHTESIGERMERDLGALIIPAWTWRSTGSNWPILTQ